MPLDLTPTASPFASLPGSASPPSVRVPDMAFAAPQLSRDGTLRRRLVEILSDAVAGVSAVGRMRDGLTSFGPESVGHEDVVLVGVGMAPGTRTRPATAEGGLPPCEAGLSLFLGAYDAVQNTYAVHRGRGDPVETRGSMAEVREVSKS